MSAREIKKTAWPEGFDPSDWGLEADAQRYTMGELNIILGTMPSGKIHLSISHPNRHPTWGEMKRIRYELIEDEVDMAMYLPSSKEYVNLHQHTFHWFQCACYPYG